MSMFNWHERHHESRDFGAKLADSVATYMGSWKFIISQTCAITIWVIMNLIEVLWKPFDPYPFILLNLIFSVQAAYAAPIIMMAQNRQAERDRHQADADYLTNIQAKEEIEQLQSQVTRIENDKLDEILNLLKKG